MKYTVPQCNSQQLPGNGAGSGGASCSVPLGIALGDFDIYHAEVFMNDVATNGELDIDYIAGKLATYSYSSQ